MESNSSEAPAANSATPLSSSSKFSKKIILIAMAVVLVVALLVGFLILPKYFTSQYINKAKPAVTSLNSATVQVKYSVGQIYSTVTDNQNPYEGGALKVSGLLIHPEIADAAISSNVLGISNTKIIPGLIESEAERISSIVKGIHKLLKENHKDVAAASASPTDTVASKFRTVKDQSMDAVDKIQKAQVSLDQTILSLKSSLFLNPEAKKIADDKTLTTNAKPYLDEALKISNYYQTVSDTVITMNTKIASFKNSISSVGTSFAVLNNPSASIDIYKTSLQQAQVYLNQAKGDSDELKKLSQKLKDFSPSTLPTNSDKYNQHNVKVLDTVTTYFDTISGAFQTLVDGTNSLLDKINSQTVTNADLVAFQKIRTTVVNDSAVGESKFVSDLQALIGEETALTLDFWQNNAILKQGEKVQTDIDDLQQKLNNIK